MADEPEQQDAAEQGSAPAADAPEPSAAVASDGVDAAEVAGDAESHESADAPAARAAPKAKAERRRRRPKAGGEEPPAASEPGAEPAAAPASAQSEGAPAETAAEKAAETVAEGAEAEAEPAAGDAAATSAPPAGAEERGGEETAAGTRAKPEVPGAHLEVDIVPEGADPLGREQPEDPYSIAYEEEEEEVEAPAEDAATAGVEAEEEAPQPIVSAAIDLAAGARYSATGKRKTAVARVILRPGAGTYTINGRSLAEYFPRSTLQRNIAQPLEAVGYQDRMDVAARLHGGGVSSQAGALRHGISRALLEADPNLRGELKRRGFLTRDSRVKERKKAGLKKARKRPQFSKR